MGAPGLRDATNGVEWENVGVAADSQVPSCLDRHRRSTALEADACDRSSASVEPTPTIAVLLAPLQRRVRE